MSDQIQITFALFLQSCVYKVIPEFGAMSGVRAKWLWLGSGHEFSTRFEAPNLDYTATIRYRNGILRYQLVNITYPEFEIKLVRKYRSHLIETIVPTGLLVAISWVRHISSRHKGPQTKMSTTNGSLMVLKQCRGAPV